MRAADVIPSSSLTLTQHAEPPITIANVEHTNDVTGAKRQLFLVERHVVPQRFRERRARVRLVLAEQTQRRVTDR